jgi:hypothetical protein
MCDGAIRKTENLRKATLCSVPAWLRVVVRWDALNLPDDHPLAVFTDNGLVSGKLEFIRPTHINAALQLVAWAVYNITDEDALSPLIRIEWVPQSICTPQGFPRWI